MTRIYKFHSGYIKSIQLTALRKIDENFRIYHDNNLRENLSGKPVLETQPNSTKLRENQDQTKVPLHLPC